MTGGPGVKKSEQFADVIYGSPLTKISAVKEYCDIDAILPFQPPRALEARLLLLEQGLRAEHPRRLGRRWPLFPEVTLTTSLWQFIDNINIFQIIKVTQYKKEVIQWSKKKWSKTKYINWAESDQFGRVLANVAEFRSNKPYFILSQIGLIWNSRQNSAKLVCLSSIIEFFWLHLFSLCK